MARSSRRRGNQRSRRRAASDRRELGAAKRRGARRSILIGALIAAVAVVVVGLSWDFITQTLRSEFAAAPAGISAAMPTFAGSETCAECHGAEAQLWRASQHAHAMDHATEKSVLGDFSDATFDYYGVKSRFFRKDVKFYADTDGPDGKLATFEVKYTFGVDPLQQYLIEFPDGRIQALSLAWDTRPKAAGGQRWFHLYPNEEIRHDDVLHWTKLNQNWNFMCAECHSTGVRKNYDAASDRFATTWTEISVGCEACHGQGSRHVAWARERQSWWPFGKRDDPSRGLLVRFGERDGVAWHHNPTTGEPERSAAPATLRKEVETCGLCHARRSELSEGWVPGRSLSNTHAIAPLARELYQADGQMQDEVYNYGSFKQSKMFAAGVTCSDCHEPHGAKLRASGDGVCLQCHTPDRYETAAHVRHEGVNPPLACASCHMPARTYMVIDPRHDHSFRIPRPDLAAKLGTTNACNGCHGDKSPDWAAAAIERWHGPIRKGFQNYGEAFHAAWTDQANAGELLAKLAADPNAPAFARAGALTELGSRFTPSMMELARNALADPDPMVRIGALDMLGSAPADRIWPLVSPLLSDSVRGVRIRAASLLAAVPTASQPPADRDKFERAAAEFVAAQRLNADRPEARTALGNFFARRGLFAEAEAEYRAGLRLSPQFAPAAVNLADLYRHLGRDADGEGVLRAALVASPRDAGLHHALGLVLVRLKRLDDALVELGRAAELDPDRARYAYVYAVGLHSAGRAGDAMAVIKDAFARHPDDRDILQALIAFNREAGDIGAALDYAERLARILPSDSNLAALIQELRRQAGKP